MQAWAKTYMCERRKMPGPTVPPEVVEPSISPCDQDAKIGFATNLAVAWQLAHWLGK
jgi:hypothetical protein